MISRFFRYVLIIFLALINSTYAQKKLSWNDQFILDKSHKPFPMQDRFVSLNNGSYNFAEAHRPAFVYISSESCIPCKFELPLYIEACKQYPGFDFVYFTTDPDTEAVKKKFGQELNLPNLYIVCRPYEFFYENQLMLGFPTKYFVNSKKQVDTVQLGGFMVKEKVLEEWTPVLTRLQ